MISRKVRVPDAERFDFATGVIDEGVGVAHVEAQQLEKHDRCQRAASERRERHQRVADVADQGGAECGGFRDGLVHGFENVRGGRGRPLPPRRHDRTDPDGKFRRRRHLAAQVRQFEVRVRVDQPRKQGNVAEVHFARFRVGRRAPSHGAVCAIRHDAAPVGDDPAVTDRRIHDRQNPGGVVADQF